MVEGVISSCDRDVNDRVILMVSYDTKASRLGLFYLLASFFNVQKKDFEHPKKDFVYRERKILSIKESLQAAKKS
jgi:hypothetical protein